MPLVFDATYYGIMARTGHRDGYPDGPSPIVSPFTPFFCVMDVEETKLAASSGEAKASMWRSPFDGRTSARR